MDNLKQIENQMVGVVDATGSGGIHLLELLDKFVQAGFCPSEVRKAYDKLLSYDVISLKDNLDVVMFSI